ncbi:MAG TPA: right-handed parallel beta-helix repeat-containing protein, partial [Caldilineaceae bacterium]|nr:right-handed parallel beta-helix repeat-containing protein [Caldilineaceae bacterium]
MDTFPPFGFAFDLGRAGSRRRRIGWWVIFGAPALLMATLLLTLRGTPAAQAASLDTFVNCGEANDNYLTIQDAVNNTAPGGVVHICPAPGGFYSESVDLALMNAGNSVGDITLIAENGPGTVLISPTVGAAIHISFTEFIADIALIGLNVTSGDSYGIDLYDYGATIISGTVLISDVVANGAGEGGIIVNATQAVTVVNTQANNNQEVGITLLAYGEPVTTAVTLDHVTANNNGDTGIYISTSGSVHITNTEANSNGVDCDGCYSGIEIWEGFPLPSSCPNPLHQVSLDQVTADDNSAFGVYIYVSGRDVRLNALQTNRNYFDGTAVEYGSPICYMGSLHLSNSVADENGLASLEPDSLDTQGEVGAEVFVPDPVGFRLTAIEEITVTNSSAAGNAAAGFCLYNEFGDIEIHDTHAENNGQDGIEFSPECRYYGQRAVAEGEPAPTEQGVEAATLSQSAIQIANTTVFSNGDNGIELEYSNEYESQITGVSEQQVNSQFLLSEQPLTITNVSALSNAENGILVSLEFHESLVSPATLDETAVLQYPPTTIASSLIQGNQQHGVRFRSRVFDYVAPDAQGIQVTQPFTPAAFVNGNIICQNIASGLSISDTVETVELLVVPEQEPLKVDAAGNWWGAASGPQHPDNPTGTGDAVIDSFNG